MKLFENGVGRPSNEIKRKRKKFVISMVVLVLSFFIAGYFVLTNLSTNKLKGASYNKNDIKVNYKVTSFYKNSNGKDDKRINIKIDSVGSDVEDVAFIACMSYDQCKEALNETGKAAKKKFQKIMNRLEDAYGENAGWKKEAIAGKEYTLKINNTGSDIVANLTLYIAMATYDKNGDLLYRNVYEWTSNSKRNDKSGIHRAYIKSSSMKKEKVNVQLISSATTKKASSSKTTKKASSSKTPNNASSSNDKLYLDCPSKANIGEHFKCYTNQAGVKITAGGSNSLESGYNASFTTTYGDLAKDIEYKDVLFKNYKKVIKKDKNGNEYIIAKVVAQKSGYKSVTKYVKIYRQRLTLTCPKTAKVNEHFLCITNQSGVKITVGGAKALSTTSTFTTTSSDMTKSVKYTNTLFNGNWKIRKDSNGNEYVNSIIVASKSGSKITRIVKIYR